MLEIDQYMSNYNKNQIMVSVLLTPKLEEDQNALVMDYLLNDTRLQKGSDFS